MSNETQQTKHWMTDESITGNGGFTTNITFSMQVFIEKLESAGITLTPAKRDSAFYYDCKVGYEFINQMKQLGQKDLCISFDRDIHGNETVWFNDEKDTLYKTFAKGLRK